MAQQVQDITKEQHIYINGETLKTAIEDHLKNSLRPTLTKLLESLEEAVATKDDALALLVALNTGNAEDINPRASSVKSYLDKIDKVTKHIERVSVFRQYLHPNHVYCLTVDNASYYGL